MGSTHDQPLLLRLVWKGRSLSSAVEEREPHLRGVDLRLWYSIQVL